MASPSLHSATSSAQIGAVCECVYQLLLRAVSQERTGFCLVDVCVANAFVQYEEVHILS